MRQRTIAAVIVVGILAGGIGLAEGLNALSEPPTRAGGSAASSTATSSADTVKWGPCDSAKMRQEMAKNSSAVCAVLAVPLDYNHPAGAKIKLALSMVRHTSPAAGYQGPMLVNPGGPGQPGLALSSIGAHVPGGVGGDYDWIGFDPRGVGASVPALTCEPNYFAGPRIAYVADSAALTNAWLKRSAGYSAACGKNGGDLLNHLTTIDSAKDMDSIRKALGQKQISYYGYSYGTYLGQVYATLYPTRLHRLVLDSNADPRTIWYQANLDQDTAFERNIKLWFAWVAKNDATYHVGSTESAVARLFYRTQNGLQAKPSGQVGGDEWNDIFTLTGYTQDVWPELATVFSARAHGSRLVQLDGIYRYVDTPGDDNGHAVYLAIQCTDTPWPKSVAQNLADTRRIARQAPYLTWQNMWFNAPCLTWPAPAHTPVKIDGSKVASALLVDQTLDAATPYEGSLEVRALFPHAALLALPGGTTHADSLSGNVCEDSTIARYLADGHLPTRRAGRQADATCAPPAQPRPGG